jgi:hypothetical protein
MLHFEVWRLLFGCCPLFLPLHTVHLDVPEYRHVCYKYCWYVWLHAGLHMHAITACVWCTFVVCCGLIGVLMTAYLRTAYVLHDSMWQH